MNTIIIIPARYGSTRFPGKPLKKILGKSMLCRVFETAKGICETVVATEDERIAEHCKEIGAPCVMTSTDCPSGTDRVYEALTKLNRPFDFVINLQGDAPLTPPSFIKKLIETKMSHPEAEVITPVVQLSFSELDELRERKKSTPFSGTTAIVKGNQALWFSKNIIPAIRKENRESPLSPVFQHIGLYGYTPKALQRFVDLKESHYEQLEGLEQLRFLENAIPIFTTSVTMSHLSHGVDSPEDIGRIEDVISHL